jgi:hypothetical protein
METLNKFVFKKKWIFVLINVSDKKINENQTQDQNELQTVTTG